MDYLEILDEQILNLVSVSQSPNIQRTIEGFLKRAVSEKKSDGVVLVLVAE